jgi:hypothetical protein
MFIVHRSAFSVSKILTPVRAHGRAPVHWLLTPYSKFKPFAGMLLRGDFDAALRLLKKQ